MAAMWRYLGIAIGLHILIVGILGDESCGGLVEVNPHSCSRLMVLRIPSDGSGLYHFVLNVSMPIYSNENIDVELENKGAVQDGTASELVYVMSHPSCDSNPRVTSLVFNDRVLCKNDAHKVSPRQPVTRLFFESTHHGIKNRAQPTQNRLPVYSERPYLVVGSNDNNGNSANNGNAFFSIPGTSSNAGSTGNQNGLFFNIPGTNNANNGNNALFSIPGLNSNRGKPGNQNGLFFSIPGTNGNNGNNVNNGHFHNPIFSAGNSGNTGNGGELFPNNPFLATMRTPSPNKDFVNRFSGSNQSNFDHNPFLTGEFTTEQPANTKVDINTICGLSSFALVQGGTEVQPGEFPWLGGLFVRSNRVYLCTVNLVSQQHAITAAHCFASSTDGGTYGILWGHPKNGNPADRTFSRVLNLELHPLYNRSTLHDVAVMTLLDRVTFTLVLKPICLWRSRESSAASMQGVVAGFGPDYTDLKKINFPIVSLDTCRASNHFFHFATSEFTFCAGRKMSDEGPCKGDSGAGYMQWMDNRYFLRGLVSHSLNANGNCNLNEYIIFSDLSKEISWVQRTISLL